MIGISMSSHRYTWLDGDGPVLVLIMLRVVWQSNSKCRAIYCHLCDAIAEGACNGAV